LAQGNHELLRDGTALPASPLDTVRLCHFPVRDPLQYAGKIAVGYLKYSAMAGWDRSWGCHYVEPFQALLDGDLQGLVRRMSADSRSYSLAKDIPRREEQRGQDLPLAYAGGPITLTPARQQLLPDVLQYAEALAKALAATSGRQPRCEQANVAKQLAEDKLALEERLARLEPMLRAAEAREQASAVELERSRQEQASAILVSQQLAEDKAALENRLSKLELELLAEREVVFIQSERLASRTYRLLDRVNGRLARAGLSPRAVANLVFWLLRIK
jgi:hypothetical protein